jgi:hypothetical protein
MRTDWQPRSFDEYMVGFLSEHTHPGTRWAHVAMLHLAVATGTTALLRRSPALMATTVLGAIAIDLGSHAVFDGAYPGKSLSRPLWSVRANFVLSAAAWRGGMDELGRQAAQARAAA